MAIHKTLALSALALAAGLSANVVVADEVMSTSTQVLERAYGRAGGLTGSDRVEAFAAGTRPVGVTYDLEVARRTNMSTDRTAARGVGVTYDETVAARTNMQRGSTKSVIAAQPGAQAN